MKSPIELLSNIPKVFEYQGKVYRLTSVKSLKGKFVILTDGKTFVFYENELKAFCAEITIYEEDQVVYEEKPAGVLNLQVPARVKSEAEMFNKVNESLFQMFQSLEGMEEISKEAATKVAVLTKISDSMVKSQLIKIKTLSNG